MYTACSKTIIRVMLVNFNWLPVKQYLERPVLLGGKICHFQHNLYQRRKEALAESGQGSQVAYSEVQGVIPKIPS